MNTILFAAGASYDFFEPNLSTEYITNKVCDAGEWYRIVEKYKSFEDPDIIIADADTIISIIETIKKYNNYANFEEIAEVIDKLSSYSMDPIPVHNTLNLFEKTLLDLLQTEGKRTLGIGLQQVPFLFREIIAETILDLENNRKSKSYFKLKRLQHSFIEYVIKTGGDISIISTNYDDCIPMSIKGLGINMGVRTSDNLHGEQVDTYDFMNARKVVYFPHGHIRFQMTDNSQVTVWNDINEANERRWSGLKGYKRPSTIYCTANPFSYNFNSFLTTGQTKDNAFNNMPYSLYYQRMALDFTNSKNIIIVGYSFGDGHLNRMLNAYLLTDPTHHIFIIDYYVGQIRMTDEFQDKDNILVKIREVFQQSWLMKQDVETGELYPFYDEEIELLNTRGYGKIFPMVTFYKKGYKCFLSEYQDVVDENLL